ncbi:MAG TPA: glucose 1-dehydrogenase [Burkholderiaceae bacterium]|nr:glucose 1-dehydrogenase [Burkholderiaceae bacterium]
MTTAQIDPRADPARMFRLDGRTAIVTGGAAGIGRAIATGFAAFGADVAIIDRDARGAAEAAAAIAAETGRRVSSHAADASVTDEVEAAMAGAIDALGHLDVLLNAAGHNLRKPLLEFERDEFDALLHVHVTGAFLTCRAAGRHMCARGRGSIVNIASILSSVGRTGVVPYAAAKGGLLQLTRAFALEMAPHGVRVNAIAPGFIDTPLTRTHDPEVRRQVSGATPMGRFGRPDELVGAAVFLASDASSFVTGASLTVDGGWTAQ